MAVHDVLIYVHVNMSLIILLFLIPHSKKMDVP